MVTARRGRRRCQTAAIPRPDDPSPAQAEAQSPARNSRLGAALGVGVTLIAAAVAVVFALPGGVDATEVVTDVVVAQDHGPEGAPPGLLPDDGLARATFSDFARRAGWVPLRARDDRIEGREALTIYWERAGHRIAYTLLPGAPLGAPAAKGRTGRRGVLIYSLMVGARTAVTWTERTPGSGRTAVVSAVGVPLAHLYDLAGGPARPRP